MGEHWVQNHYRILESKLALVDPQHQQLILEYVSSDVPKESETSEVIHPTISIYKLNWLYH